MMILGALGLLGTAIVYNAVSDRNVSRYEKDSADALAAAETGLAVAKRMIQDISAPMTDADADGYPDFTLSDTLSWGGSYNLVAEAGEIKDVDISAYRADGFTIVCEGEARGAKRRTRVQIMHDSFLKYARFVEATGTSYECRALLTGEVYLGGDLILPTCPSGREVTFLEYVATTGDIPNASAGIFMRGYVTDAPQVDLENSVDFADMRNRAKGIGPDPSCKGVGSVGLYQNPAGGWDPMNLASTGNTLVLHKLDFYNTTSIPGDTLVNYNGVPVDNVVTGQPLRANEFNGIVFFENDAHVKGHVQGVSGRCMTIFATDDVFADSSIVCGTKGFDPVTRLPNGSGDPVNIGLVGSDYFYLGPVPRICQIDAALMAVNANWRAFDSSTAAHPPYLIPPVDLDMDGIFGENPFNHDPDPNTGWNEQALTANHWVLNINGPIITSDGGSAAPWSNGAIVGGAPGPTRRYNYDLDITQFPPPCYPVPLNIWLDVSWTELFDAEGDLVDFLP